MLAGICIVVVLWGLTLPFQWWGSTRYRPMEEDKRVVVQHSAWTVQDWERYWSQHKWR